MREIKFRAWDEKHKHMFIVKEFGRSENNIWCTSKLNGYKHWNAPMMQYTSLKDKNGKEIYEGDIVRFHYKTGVYKIGTVVWNDLFGSWDIDCSDFVSYKSLGQYKSVSEVIGNIFEHKHMLEGTE